MKTFWLFFIAVVGILLDRPPVSAQVVVTDSVVAEVTSTFASLFDALKRGDVRAMKLFLPPEKYAEYRVLLEKNKDYPNFLRNYYQTATMRVGQVDSVANASAEVIGEFIIDFPNSETMIVRMRLIRDNIGWKIKKILAGENDQGEPSGEGRR